jgi:hypothetical protein
MHASKHDHEAFTSNIPNPSSLDLELESRESSILVSGYAFCLEQSGELYDCGHCRAFTYCCKDPFLRDRASHGPFCDLIGRGRLTAEGLRHELVVIWPMRELVLTAAVKCHLASGAAEEVFGLHLTVFTFRRGSTSERSRE